MINPCLHQYFHIQRVLLALIILKRLAKLLSHANTIYRLTEALSSTPGYSSNTNNSKGSGVPTATQQQKEYYTYDAVGNRQTGPETKDSYTYNPGNQLTSDRKHQYQYDKNGNLVKKTETDDDGEPKTWTYSYDYENHLIRVIEQEEDETKTVIFKYDPFGRRIEKKVSESSSPLVSTNTSSPSTGEGGGGGETKTYTYIYDNEDIILEYLTKIENGQSKTEITRYVHGPGIDEPLSIERKGEIYYYHADGLGSITVLTDKKQKVVESYTYSSFGEIKRQGDKVKNTFTYTGREWDEEIGLYYYRARYYDAKVGRFISFDPILKGVSHTEVAACTQSIPAFPLQSPQELNPFVYVGNNPVNFTDAAGLCPEVPDITFVQTAIRTGQTPVQITYLISCKLVKSEKVKIGSKCLERCSYNCKQTWSWVAPESGKTFGGKTTFPKQYEFEIDESECCK